MRIRAATRGSPLALWQTEWVTALLTAAVGDGDVVVEQVIVDTAGDRNRDVALHAIGGQGVFVKEVQAAVLDGRADIAVHSAKDLPSETANGLVMAAVPERGDARDALVGSTLDGLPTGGRVATGSVRRRAQLANLRPDLTFAELRGNIGTRLEKAVDFDAIVVAAAALRRLSMSARITEALDPALFVPQVAQGALAIECRTDDLDVQEMLARIEDLPSRLAVDAERAFLARLGGGCTLPAGAYAVVSAPDSTASASSPPRSPGPPSITLSGLLASDDGRIVLRHTSTGTDPLELGAEVVGALLDAGGRVLVDHSTGADGLT